MVITLINAHILALISWFSAPSRKKPKQEGATSNRTTLRSWISQSNLLTDNVWFADQKKISQFADKPIYNCEILLTDGTWSNNYPDTNFGVLWQLYEREPLRNFQGSSLHFKGICATAWNACPTCQYLNLYKYVNQIWY